MTADPAAYVDTAVRDWQRAPRRRLYEADGRRRRCAPARPARFLVWGDPALYDGTLDLLQRIAGRTHDRLRSCRSPASAASPPSPPRTGWS